MDDYLSTIAIFIRQISSTSTSQSQKHDESYRVAIIIFDLRSRLHDIYKKLKRKQSIAHLKARLVTAKHREIAEIFHGSPNVKRDSIRQADSVASRVSTKTIKAIGKLVTNQEP